MTTEKGNTMTTTFTIKNVKTCDWASEETTCFTATVYMNGKRLGNVRNEGHGGCNFYDFDTKEMVGIASDFLWNDHLQFCNEFNLPEGTKETFNGSADRIIDNLLDQYELVKQVKLFKNRLAKRNPAHANNICIFVKGDDLCATIVGTQDHNNLLNDSTATIAPTTAEITL